MLKYLIIILDDSSVSYCHYSNRVDRKLISIEDLTSGIIWAMKENLMVQMVYPEYELPKEYLSLIDSVDHIDIKPIAKDADVSIINGIDELLKSENLQSHVILRLSISELINNVSAIGHYSELNIVLTDIDKTDESTLDAYRQAMLSLSDIVCDRMCHGEKVAINILTDRLSLSSMNNCNAGGESLTLAPDGRFYVCPAFYYDNDYSIGTPKDGLDIKNPNLYKLSHAPICRDCDAYHCKRCIWLNHKMTREVNTPSHEQCVISHHERLASRLLQENLAKAGIKNTGAIISEIKYNDPFEKFKR